MFRTPSTTDTTCPPHVTSMRLGAGGEGSGLDTGLPAGVLVFNRRCAVMSFRSITLMPDRRLIRSLEGANCQMATLATGCNAVDTLLCGGFPTGIVSEVCGVAGSGKTQLALQLLLQAQLPEDDGGLHATSCYMYTDGLSPLKRLDEMAKAYPPSVSLDKIYLEVATDPPQLLHALKTRLPSLLDRHRVRLVVIDAITVVFRGIAVENAADAGDRTKVMFEMVNCMRILAAKYDAAFVVINQMTTNMTTGTVPALGLAWSTCVNQRFQLAKARNASTRTFKTIFSPYLPHDAIALFEITSSKLE